MGAKVSATNVEGWLNDLIRRLAFWAAYPGAIVLTLGNPSRQYKLIILAFYLVASSCSIIYAKRTNQKDMYYSSVGWLILELYGLLGPGIDV